ncbi:TMEM175 family protein [Mucilaginibacter endophyticus]|uniref:TMEM175 family protein n=1 Tax=Mucilaginibacter endophyticus TaxID=2675003 RepID=UPI000E0CE1B3|nr:TMEM175 family protein [Mucilaginibacter endophyticus]
MALGKGRLEAFSDGVIAIIITIMVLELKVPHDESLAALKPLIPVFLSYLLSFVYVGIYWNNHHHTMQAVRSVNGKILWANLHLLFWLSLIPFVTAWMGENHLTQWPVFFYGVVLIMNGIAYRILALTLIKHHGEDSLIAQAFGTDFKGKASVLLYAVAILCTWVNPTISVVIYVLVAGTWFIPDKRFERLLE